MKETLESALVVLSMNENPSSLHNGYSALRFQIVAPQMPKGPRMSIAGPQRIDHKDIEVDSHHRVSAELAAAVADLPGLEPGTPKEAGHTEVEHSQGHPEDRNTQDKKDK